VYGNEVSRLARPLPIEYLLVDIPASTPLQPLYTFPIKPGKETFPVEHRFIDKHLQDFTSLSSYLLQFTTTEFLDVSTEKI
jgi:nuclear protein localization protein 4 homolog